MIRLAASMPKGSSERKALLNVLASGYSGGASFRRKADALALAVFEKTRHLSHVPQELVDKELARLKPGTFLDDDVLEHLWTLVHGNPWFIEGYGKLDWHYLQNNYFRSNLTGSPWGAKFWQTFFKEAQRKL
jgi:hypothetical protein